MNLPLNVTLKQSLTFLESIDWDLSTLFVKIEILAALISLFLLFKKMLNSLFYKVLMEEIDGMNDLHKI